MLKWSDIENIGQLNAKMVASECIDYKLSNPTKTNILLEGMLKVGCCAILNLDSVSKF